MKRCHLWTLSAVAGVALVSVMACNRTEKTPAPSTTPAPGSTAPAPPGAASGTPPTGAALAPPAGTTPAPSAAMPVAGNERTFVNDAAASGMAEVEAARYVADKTADSALKAFAQQMDREHTSANDELKRIAGNKGITVPAAVEGAAKTRLDSLKALSGKDLDAAFIRDFGLAAHDEAIKVFETEARDGQDPELRAFAERTLPRLREHRTMAAQLQGRTG